MARLYWASGLTGGGNSMDGISTTGLAAGDGCFVLRDSSGVPQILFYRVYASSSTENSPYVIAPDTSPGTLRWHLVDVLTNTSLSTGTATPLGVLHLETDLTDTNPVLFVKQGAVATADATETTLWTTTLDDNTVYFFEATVVARQTVGTGIGNGFGFKLHFCAYRYGGVATEIPLVQGLEMSSYAPGSAADLVKAKFDVSGNAVRVRVTGIAAKTILWVTTVLVSKVST